MSNTYYLKIKAEEKYYTLINSILGVEANNTIYGWNYEVNVNGNDQPYDFINEFCNLLDGKYEELNLLGIERDDISIWKLYAYDQQCNMEFGPKEMKRLGDNGLTLCISCYETGESDDDEDDIEDW